jgi:type IV secretory pathway VirB4 component
LEIENILLNSSDDVIVIDPYHEYAKFVGTLGGSYIPIEAGGNNCVNPLDLPDSKSHTFSDFLLNKTDFLIPMFSWIFKDMNMTFAENHRHVIDVTCQMIYDPKLNDTPDLRDFDGALNSQFTPAAEDLSKVLTNFLNGSLSIFTRATNIDNTKQLTVYDISDLGNHDIPFGLLVLLEQVRNLVISNSEQEKRTWIFIEGVDDLIHNDILADYAWHLFKRARTHGAIVTGTAQNISTDTVNYDQLKILENMNIRTLNSKSKEDLNLLLHKFSMA